MARSYLDAAIRHRSLPVQVQLIPRKYVRWSDCVLQPTSYSRTTGNVLVLQLPAAHKDDFTIEDFDEVWVGVLNEDSEWTDVLFGGLIIKRTISAIGVERRYRLELVSYDYELTHISVPSWPTADLNATPTSGYEIVGMRPNLPNSTDNPDIDGVDAYDADPEATVHTARQWVEADHTTLTNTDRGGLLPAHTHDFIMGDVGAWDDGIQNTRITNDIRPSNSNIPGHLSITTAHDAIQQVMDVVSFAAIKNGDPPKMPAFWMEAIPDPSDPTLVTARLRVIDLLAAPAVTAPDDADVDWWFSDVRPLPVGAHKYFDASMEHDATLYQNYVEVFGHGGQSAGFDPTTHDELFAVVYAEANETPFTYTLPHSGPTTAQGVQGQAYVLDDILDRQQAQFMANWILSLAANIAVRVYFSTYCDVRPGQIIWLKNQTWPFDGPTKVLEVDNVIREGMMIRRVTCGWPKLDAKSVASGPLAILARKAFPLGAVTGNVRGITPGMGGFGTFNTHPTGQPDALNGAGNSVQARYDNQANTRIRVPSAVTNRNEYGQILGVSVFQYYRDLQDPDSGIGSEAQKAAAQAVPEWMFTDIFGLPRDWYNAKDGTNHPVHLLYEFVDDEWQSHLQFDPATFVEMRLTELDEDREIVTGVLSRVTVNMERSRPGLSKVVISPLPDRTNPMDIKYGDVLHVQVLNIPAGHKVVMFLSERLPLVEGRTALPTTIDSDTYTVSP